MEIFQEDRGQPTISSSIEKERKRRNPTSLQIAKISPLSAARFFPRQQRGARCDDDDERCPAFSGIYFPRGACIDDRADDLVLSRTEIEFVEVNSILVLSVRACTLDLSPSSGLLSLFLSFFLNSVCVLLDTLYSPYTVVLDSPHQSNCTDRGERCITHVAGATP